MINEILLHEKVIMHSTEGSENFKVHIYKGYVDAQIAHRFHLSNFLIQLHAETSYIFALILRC